MLELGGGPLIRYPLAMLKRGGITEVAINLHHLGSLIQRGLGDGSALGMRITYAPEPVLLGTGGPLNGLRDFLGAETFVIANSDTILDLDLRAMLAFHRDRAALATIALFRPTNLDYYSRLEIDAAEKLRRMRLLTRRDPLTYDEYPLALDDTVAATLSSLMYCGVIVAEPAVLDLIPREAAVEPDGRLVRPDGSERPSGLRLRPHRLLPHDGRYKKFRSAEIRVRVVAATIFDLANHHRKNAATRNAAIINNPNSMCSWIERNKPRFSFFGSSSRVTIRI